MKSLARNRGVALLLVLATLVLATTAAVALAAIAINTRLTADALRRTRTADRLLDATEPAIVDWLQRHAGRLVLPPDVMSPGFKVLEDTFEFDGVLSRITVTAFDQCGMVSATVRSGAIDGQLPPGPAQSIEALGATLQQRPGLDLLAASTDSRVYPASETSTPAWGELIATHNPPRPGGRAVVNINTAPIPLVEAVYRARGLSGIDAVLAARAEGRVASPGTDRAPQGTDDHIPLPVSMSTAWAFRVDFENGGVRRSWWCVYADTGSNWERVQRLAITE